MPLSIRRQLHVSAALAVAVALTAVVRSSAQTEAEQERARAAAREVSLLLVLTQEYPRYFSARVAEQWMHGHARLSKALDRALPQAPAGEGEAMNQLRQVAQRLPVLFTRLRETPSLPHQRVELLVDQLTNETQTLVDGIYEWSRGAAQANRQAQQRFREVAAVSVAALALLLFGQAFWFLRRVLRPLRRIEAATRAVESGRLDVRIGVQSRDELGRLSRSFDAMTQSLAERTRQLDELARVDTLTGLPNRRHFMEKLDEAMARSPRAQRPMALMYLDIDHFKAINDTRGHGVGDAVLQQFAERLRAAVRVTDTVARLAGDEFVIVVEGLHVREEASLVAEKIVASMGAPMAVEGGEVRVTTSIGVAVLGPGMRSADELLARADAALYAAKRAGRNTFSLSAF